MTVIKKQEETNATLRAFYIYAHFQYLSITSLLAKLEDQLGIPWSESKLPNRKRAAKDKARRDADRQ